MASAPSSLPRSLEKLLELRPKKLLRGCQTGAIERASEGAPRLVEKTKSMAGVTDDVEQLERVLLMRGLGALEADRSRCADCGRSPLTGENVHLYEGTREPLIVCELCRQLRPDRPLTSETVRHGEYGQTVRITARKS